MSDDLWHASRQKSGCRRPAIAIGGLEPRQYQFALLSGRDGRRVVWTADWVRELDALGSYPLANDVKTLTNENGYSDGSSWPTLERLCP
jgi:hypothetical protein